MLIFWFRKSCVLEILTNISEETAVPICRENLKSHVTLIALNDQRIPDFLSEENFVLSSLEGRLQPPN